jgi:hypothetical protein
MSFISPNTDKSQQGGKVSGGVEITDLINLIQMNDGNRVLTEPSQDLSAFLPQDTIDPNTYYPSSSEPVLKGQFSAGNVSMPIFAPNMRFPYGLLDARQNALREAALAGLKSAPTFSINPPKLFESAANYQADFTANWMEDVMTVIKDTQRSNPQDWYRQLRKPDSKLSQKVREYENIASALETMGDRVALLTKQEAESNGKFIVPAKINEFYTKAGDWVYGENKKIDITKLNKLYETMFASPVNYATLLSSLNADRATKESKEIRSDIDPSRSLEETTQFITPEDANMYARSWIDLAYVDIANTHKEKFSGGLPGRPGDMTSKQRTELEQYVSEDIQKAYGIKKDLSSLGAKSKAGGAGANKKIVVQKENNYSIPLQAPIRVWKNGTEVESDSIDFDYVYKLPVTERNKIILPSTKMFDLSTREYSGDKLSYPGLKGEVVAITYGQNPFEKSADKGYFAVVALPLVNEVLSGSPWDMKTTTQEDKQKKKLVIVPFDAVEGIKNSIEFEDF